MTVRQILQLEGSVTVPGLPLLDITANELAVANIDSLLYWPGLFSWDIDPAGTGFRDRVTDVACPTSGAASVASRFINFADGHPAYSINAQEQVLKQAVFPASGGFTIGVVVGLEVGCGSFSAAGNPWDTWFVSSSLGKIRFGLGTAARNTYDSYTGPLLNNAKMTAVVFIYDRAAGELRLRINGVLVDTLADPALKTMVVKNELMFGQINAGTPQMRIGSYRVPIGFSKALVGAELASLEAMLAESVY
jgi:hypothetical protein